MNSRMHLTVLMACYLHKVVQKVVLLINTLRMLLTKLCCTVVRPLSSVLTLLVVRYLSHNQNILPDYSPCLSQLSDFRRNLFCQVQRLVHLTPHLFPLANDKRIWHTSYGVMSRFSHAMCVPVFYYRIQIFL